MSLRSQLGKLPLLADNPGMSEIEDMLSVFSEAVLLVDIQHKRIYAANPRASELTSYSRPELYQLDLNLLFDNLDIQDWKTITDNEPISKILLLIRRNTTQLEVQATIIQLQSKRKWCLVKLEPASLVQQREGEKQWAPKLWDILQAYSESLQEDNPDIALQIILKIASTLTGADILCIYQAGSNDLELTRRISYGPEGYLPERLPAEDLSILRTEYLWTPGKRLVSNLHRHARVSELTYLATIPLGEPHALVGILALASDQPVSGEIDLHHLQLLADTIVALLQQKSRLNNLEQALEQKSIQCLVSETIEKIIQDAVVILTPNLRIDRLNSSAEELLGYPSEEATGQSISKIFIGAENLLSAIEVAQRGISTLNLKSIKLYKRSGQEFTAEASTIPMMMAEEESCGVAILLRDLTEQEVIQLHNQQLEHRAYLGQFIYIFAHEVRNPINNIGAGLQLMELTLPPNDPNHETISRLQQDCDRLEGLVKTILSTAKPFDYELDEIDLVVLITRLLERMKPKISRAKVQHNLHVEPSLPHIRGNPRAIEQVFNNLIDNAINAMKEQGGTLALKLRKIQHPNERCYVEISVADSGPGIPSEILEHIFEPFYTTNQSGTGLGLAITNRIINAHKGFIRVESFVGGTIFYVQLPTGDEISPPESSQQNH